MSKTKVDRTICGARDESGWCIPLDTPCDSVGEGLCVSVRYAYTLGSLEREEDFDNQKEMVRAFGLCPFCRGEPKLKKPNWFEVLVLGRGWEVRCSKCKSKLISVNRIYPCSKIVIEIPKS